LFHSSPTTPPKSTAAHLTAGCYKKSSCPPNSATQDITIFGALLVVHATTSMA
jgi:hypothetical protein